MSWGWGAPCARRAGTALADLIAALVLAAVLAVAVSTLLSAQLRLGARVNGRAAAGEAARTAAVVLPGELRTLDIRTDVGGVGPDSLALRAFRGVGVVCAVGVNGAVVRYRGIRAPDLTKDSLLVVRAGVELPWRPTGVTAAAHPCAAADETTLRLLPTGPLRAGDLLLLFERGSYHLAEGALRYRRGAGGRQPLTGELLLPGSGFEPAAWPWPGTTTLRAYLLIATPGTPGGTPLDVRVQLVNGGAP